MKETNEIKEESRCTFDGQVENYDVKIYSQSSLM